MNEYKVKPEDENQRIDKLLTMLNRNYTRSQIKGWFDQSQICVNDHSVKANYRLKSNDVIKWTLPEEKIPSIAAENISLDIVYEDADVMIINKEKGMVVHPSPGHSSGTLVNALLHHTTSLSSIGEKERPGIVHRLDKDTSGLLVIAKNDTSYSELAKQFKDRTIMRHYVALVHGNISHEKGVIDAPIGRDPNNRQRMAVVDGGNQAITHFHVIESFRDYSYIACQLETGRTHQIRVHMKYIRHPLVGDKKYGPRKTFNLNGQALHAKQLGFYHPTTKEWMMFKTDLPNYFKRAMERIRNMY